jgi:hypothetical protein
LKLKTALYQKEAEGDDQARGRRATIRFYQELEMKGRMKEALVDKHNHL